MRRSPSANDGKFVQLLFIKNDLVPRNNCYVHYASGVFYLLNDDASGWFGLHARSNKTVGNSQCTIYGLTSGVSNANDADSPILLDVSFRTKFSGAKEIYLLAGDNTGVISGWQKVGDWAVEGDPKTLELVSLAPNSGSGGAVTLTSIVKAGDGANTIVFTQLLMNNVLNGYNACYIHYDRALNVFFLLKDDASAWLGLWGGREGQVENSQCVLSGKNSTGTAVGDTLTVTYDLRFKGGFNGNRQIYLWSADDKGVVQPWTQVGTWNVPTMSGLNLSSAGGSSVSSRGGSGQGLKQPPGGPVFETPRFYRVRQRGNVWLVGAEDSDVGSPKVTQPPPRNGSD